MAKTIIVQGAHEFTSKVKTASCPGRLQWSVPMRLLVEVHGEHVAFGYGVRTSEWDCKPCAPATELV